MKQTKLRRKRVFRYAVLYFTLLIIFLGLIVAPTVAGPNLGEDVFPSVLTDMKLVQKNKQENNDTTTEPTGKPVSGGGDDDDDDKDKRHFLVI